jgi:hypothetical protein
VYYSRKATTQGGLPTLRIKSNSYMVGSQYIYFDFKTGKTMVTSLMTRIRVELPSTFETKFATNSSTFLHHDHERAVEAHFALHHKNGRFDANDKL